MHDLSMLSIIIVLILYKNCDNYCIIVIMLCSQRSKLVPDRLAAVVKQQGQVNLHIHVSGIH